MVLLFSVLRPIHTPLLYVRTSVYSKTRAKSDGQKAPYMSMSVSNVEYKWALSVRGMCPFMLHRSYCFYKLCFGKSNLASVFPKAIWNTDLYDHRLSFHPSNKESVLSELWDVSLEHWCNTVNTVFWLDFWMQPWCVDCVFSSLACWFSWP